MRAAAANPTTNLDDLFILLLFNLIVFTIFTGMMAWATAARHPVFKSCIFFIAHGADVVGKGKAMTAIAMFAMNDSSKNHEN